MRFFLFLFSLSSIFIPQEAFGQEITLPYQELEGWPIVKVKIDHKEYNFVFDTGAAKTVVDLAIKSDLEIIDDIEITDFNKSNSKMSLGLLPKIEIGHYQLDSLTVIPFNLEEINKYLCEVKIDGIIGRDIMKEYVIELQPKEKTIKFWNRKGFETKRLKMFAKIPYNHEEPRIRTKFQGRKRWVVFDTGFSGGLTVSDHNISGFIKRNKHIIFYREGNTGLFGKGERFKGYQIENTKLKFPRLKMKNQYFSTNGKGINTMGFEYIKNFHTFLDLSNKRIYLNPYANQGLNPNYKNLFKYGFSLSYNPDQNTYYVNGRTKSNDQLKLKEQVLKINGQALPKNHCEFNHFKANIFTNNMEITVLHDGKEKIVNYHIPEEL